MGVAVTRGGTAAPPAILPSGACWRWLSGKGTVVGAESLGQEKVLPAQAERRCKVLALAPKLALKGWVAPMAGHVLRRLCCESSLSCCYHDAIGGECECWDGRSPSMWRICPDPAACTGVQHGGRQASRLWHVQGTRDFCCCEATILCGNLLTSCKAHIQQVKLHRRRLHAPPDQTLCRSGYQRLITIMWRWLCTYLQVFRPRTTLQPSTRRHADRLKDFMAVGSRRVHNR